MHQRQGLILTAILSAGISAGLSYFFLSRWDLDQGVGASLKETTIHTPSLVDAYAVNFGLVLGISLRTLGVVFPLGRIHSFACIGLLLAVGALLFLSWPSDSLVRIAVLPGSQFLIVIWIIITASKYRNIRD
jgi:hypothetical protein